MSYKQIRNFDPAKMGTRKGYCLGNCEDGYGFSAADRHAASAVADMESQRKNGTFHEGVGSLPHDADVPVYCDTASKYEHVIVSVKGDVFYSDGKQVNLYNFKPFGWGECLGGTRVVEHVADPVPEPTPEPAPEPTPEPEDPRHNGKIEIGDVVVPTRLVDYNGTSLRQWDDNYTVTEVNGDRCVLMARGAIWAAMNINDVREV